MFLGKKKFECTDETSKQSEENFQKKMILVFHQSCNHPKNIYLTFSSETKTMKITHSELCTISGVITEDQTQKFLFSLCSLSRRK